MKLLSKILMTFLTVAFFSSCDGLNELPEFSDKDAFVSFASTSSRVGETAGTFTIPVTLNSLKGVESVAYYTITNNTAVEGTHFVITGNKSLSFSADSPTDSIRIQIIDNDNFDGDINFKIDITDAGSVSLGASRSITVTIEDDEHPLVAILGAYTAKGDSYFDGPSEWTVTLEKDDSDLNKVWFTNFVVGGTSKKVYGTINDEKTELRIPVKQSIASSSSYSDVRLEGFYGPDGEIAIPTGGYITVNVDMEAGVLTIVDEFASAAINASGGVEGYYNAFKAGVVLTKN